ncbi:MAG: Sjogren's syndrome/scleroderma autoantigen 1 family protein [Candidatus Hydrothermarchaeaceae archaeon]
MPSDKTVKDMAEMLLKGAKMLQYHCDTCKSPLFQKEGKIICPVCGELKKGGRKRSREKSSLDEKTKAALEKKRDDLLGRLEKEKKSEEISAILDALTKIEKMLNP